MRVPEAVRLAVALVLGRPGVFLNTSSDATVLPLIIDSAAAADHPPAPTDLEADVARLLVDHSRQEQDAGAPGGVFTPALNVGLAQDAGEADRTGARRHPLEAVTAAIEEALEQRAVGEPGAPAGV